ncbi:MAG: hypothetical protein JXX14_15360, partial [Deltaproteobacteria bacterium]|nr:hypothetical protein [Deltaproteobacteria bacterium]
GAEGIALPELNCSPIMVAQGRTMCCNTTGADTGEDTGEDTGADTGEDTGEDTGADTGEDTGEDTGADTGEDTSEPGVCPYACTYDVWNCENGDISGLGAVGFPVPELTCSDEMVAQGKTLCCNTVDEPPADPDACPFECTWDVWNCENGELGAEGIALPELNCSNANVRQGRTMCCDTTGAAVDTDSEISINECPYECTWDIASCQLGADLGKEGMALPDLNCSDEYVAQGRTMCCRTDIVVNE